MFPSGPNGVESSRGFAVEEGALTGKGQCFSVFLEMERNMKRIFLIRICAAMTMLALPVWGRIPEPDTIVVGTLGNAPSAGGVEVRAVVDGATLASAGVTAETGKFVLRIPMDDGASPRLEGTAKANDRVRLVAVNTATGAEAEILETADGGMEIPSGRGQVIQGMYRVAEGSLDGGDADGDGLPDAWEAQYAAGKNGHAGLNPATNDAKGDNDGDGRSNWEEYVAGTDPLDENSVFSVVAIDVTGRVVSVTAGPGASGRKYSLMRTAELGEAADWKSVATVEGASDGGSVALPWKGTAVGGYFRVDVEVAK